jgi:hypothetical protein
MILKTIVSIVCVCTSLSAISQCTPEQSIQLQETWRKYVLAANVRDPKIAASFFNFPLRLLSYSDGDKPLIINKQFFLRNYRLMFVDNQIPGNSDFYAEFESLKKISATKILEESKQKSCGGVNSGKPKISLGMFELYWNVDTGWRIHDIYYSNNDKENLFYMLKNPE